MASPGLPVPLIAGAVGGLSVFLFFNAQGASVGTGLPASAIVGLLVYYFASVVGQQPSLQPTEAVKPKKKTKQEKQKQKPVPSSATSDDDVEENSTPAAASQSASASASASAKKKDKKAKKAAAAAAAAAALEAENESEASEVSELSETSEGDDEDDSSALSKNAKKKAKKKAKELAAKKEEEKKAAAAAAAAAAASAKKPAANKKEEKKVQPTPAPAAAPAAAPAPTPAKKEKKPATAPAPAAQPAASLAPPQEEEAFQQSKSDKKKNKKDEKAKKREEAKHTQSQPIETPKTPTPISPSIVAPSKKPEAKVQTAIAAPVSLSPPVVAAEFEEGEWNIAKAGKPTSAQKKEIKAAESKAAESLSSSSKTSEPADYVDIAVSKIPAIIGTKGAVLKALQEGTGAIIEVPKAAERDLQSMNARILIRGDPEQVKNAKICVKSLAEKGFSYITHPGFVSDDIYVEGRQHGLIIGPKGATLKTIQTKTGTIIRMPDKGGNDRILIVGQKEGVKEAKEAIKQLVQDGFSKLTHEGYEKKEIDFPSGRLGILIGPGGQTIKSIQGNTQTQIKIPGRDSESQKVVVFGPASRLAQAEKEILKLLEPKVKKTNKTEDGKDEDAEGAAGEEGGNDGTNGEAAPQSAFDAWAAAEVQQTSEDAMWGATQ